MDLQKILKERVLQIVREERANNKDKDFEIIQQGIKWNVDGEAVLLLYKQHVRDYEIVNLYKTIVI